MTEAPHLLVDEEDEILIATFNRPEKYNALSTDLMARFEAAVLRFRDTPHLKVMLIRATGKYFSAGADLLEGGSGNRPMPDTGSGIREYHRLGMRNMHRIYDEMEAIEKPFVVAHQGITVGGGLEMSLSCDFRLACESAKYSFPETVFGVLPASNGVSRLVRIVGTHWARYLLMGNFKPDARKALIMGLVHEVWPDAEFPEKVMEFCRHLAKNNGEQMGTAKLAIEMSRDLGAAQARNVERMANSVLMLAPNYREIMDNHIANIGKKQSRD